MFTKKSFALAVALTCLAGVVNAQTKSSTSRPKFLSRVKTPATVSVTSKPATVTTAGQTVTNTVPVTAVQTATSLVAGAPVDLGLIDKYIVTKVGNKVLFEDTESGLKQEVEVPAGINLTVVKGVVGIMDGKLYVIEPGAEPRLVDTVPTAGSVYVPASGYQPSGYNPAGIVDPMH